VLRSYGFTSRRNPSTNRRVYLHADFVKGKRTRAASMQPVHQTSKGKGRQHPSDDSSRGSGSGEDGRGRGQGDRDGSRSPSSGKRASHTNAKGRSRDSVTDKRVGGREGGKGRGKGRVMSEVEEEEEEAERGKRRSSRSRRAAGADGKQESGSAGVRVSTRRSSGRKAVDDEEEEDEEGWEGSGDGADSQASVSSPEEGGSLRKKWRGERPGGERRRETGNDAPDYVHDLARSHENSNPTSAERDRAGTRVSGRGSSAIHTIDLSANRERRIQLDLTRRRGKFTEKIVPSTEPWNKQETVAAVASSSADIRVRTGVERPGLVRCSRVGPDFQASVSPLEQPAVHDIAATAAAGQVDDASNLVWSSSWEEGLSASFPERSKLPLTVGDIILFRAEAMVTGRDDPGSLADQRREDRDKAVVEGAALFPKRRWGGSLSPYRLGCVVRVGGSIMTGGDSREVEAEGFVTVSDGFEVRIGAYDAYFCEVVRLVKISTNTRILFYLRICRTWMCRWNPAIALTGV